MNEAVTKRQNPIVVKAMPTMEGAGVTVHRTIGTPTLRNFDPFLMLDHFSTDNPDDYIAGFPSHPHRGFNTFTYMIDGHMEHKDSMGNTGNLRAGGAQWMKAASGVIHSEMPKQDKGLMRGFQLWINLPASQKMSDPAYQEFSPQAFPVVEQEGASVRVLIGEYAGKTAPISDPNTDVLYLDVNLRADARFEASLPFTHNTFIYVFEGNAQLDANALSQHTLIALPQNESFALQAGKQGARFILVSGKPINEPIVQYGPFVMNTREEIELAIHDYHANRLVQKRAVMNTDQ